MVNEQVTLLNIDKRLLVAVVVVNALLVLSAIAVSYTAFQTRHHIAIYENLLEERNQLKVQHGKLMLEESSWANIASIERLAKEHLGMRLPRAGDISLQSGVM